MREQMQRLLEAARFRNVDLQVPPLSREENSDLAVSFRLLRLTDGTTVAHVEVQQLSRVVADSKQVQLLDMRYGIIRAQALTPRE